MSDRMTATRFAPPQQEAAAQFAAPSGGQLMVSPPREAGGMPAVVTAQKVAVERSHEKIMAQLRVLAQSAGDAFLYRFPVKNRRTGQVDHIEGPSIKAANTVARLYGNCEVDTRVIDQGDSWVIYAKFSDYETGYSLTRPFQQRKGQATMGGFDQGRSLDIALQIGVSKAIRNVVCNALDFYTDFAFEEARSSIVDKVGKNLERYRQRVADRLSDLHIEQRRVEAAVGRPLGGWLAPDVTKVIAQLQAINDGMASIDETWPPAEGSAAPPRPTREESQPAQVAQETTGAQVVNPQQNGEDTSHPGNEGGAIQADTEGEGGQPAEQQAEDEEVYHIVDMGGEIASFKADDLPNALSALSGSLREAARATGHAGIDGILESNQGFLDALMEREKVEPLRMVREMAETLRVFIGGQQPASVDTQPERSDADLQARNPEPAAGRGKRAQSQNKPAAPRGEAQGAGEPSNVGGSGPPPPQPVEAAMGGSDPVISGVGGSALADAPIATGSSSSYEVEAPLRPDKSTNFQLFRDMLMERVRTLTTIEELRRYEAANANNLRKLEEAYRPYAETVRGAWAKAAERLGAGTGETPP